MNAALSAADVLNTVGAQRPPRTPSATHTAWEPIIPLTPPRVLPPFPVDVFPPWVRDMVTETTTALQVPTDLPATLALAGLAIAAGGRADVTPMPGWVEPTNLYTVVALAPGSRKSRAFRDMTGPLYAAEQALCEATAPARIEANLRARRAREQAERAAQNAATEQNDPDAALAEAISAACAAEQTDDVPEPRLIADDLTPESAVTLLAKHDGRLGLLSAEGGSFTTLTGTRYSAAANLEPLLKAHAGDMMRIDRKGRPAERVERPALTIAFTTQPGNLAAIANAPEARERGLLARFLYCLPVNTVGNRQIGPPPISQGTRDEYGRHLAGLVTALYALPERALITFDADAVDALDQLQRWIEPRLHPHTGSLAAVADWASKMAGAAVRIAGLLHLASHGPEGIDSPIRGETMRAGEHVARYYLAHTLAVFDTLTADPDYDGARRILAWIDKTRPAEFTRRELHRALESKRFARASDLDAPLALLTERGYLREHTQHNPKGGRPSVAYHVHPDLNRTA
ncbi:MAG: YfjI family protein [Dermatophilus congolensis]|nr:YfjI family protein [Dermatophilus congolensis]